MGQEAEMKRAVLLARKGGRKVGRVKKVLDVQNGREGYEGRNESVVKNNKGPLGFGNDEVVGCSWKTGFGGCTAEWYGLIWFLIARGVGKGYNSFREQSRQ